MPGLELPTKPVLTLGVAQAVAAAARTEAVANGWNVVIAIVDDGANLICLHRMDDAQIGSIEIAQEKARSAVKFKRPTKAFEEALTGGRLAVLRLRGALPVEGGLPLLVAGRLVGAIGVSGVTSPQDAQIAQAGVDALDHLAAAG